MSDVPRDYLVLAETDALAFAHWYNTTGNVWVIRVFEHHCRHHAADWEVCGAAVSHCRSCHAPVYWVRTPSGRPMPVSVNTDVAAECVEPTMTTVGRGISHFADCPNASQHRKSRE